MNKQELIGKYEDKLKDVQLKFGANFKTKVYDGLIKDLKQLDEPQKVTIPQFVADYIKDAKYYEWDLGDVFNHIANESGESEISKWFYILGNIDVFARAWLDGYTVEKEKRYLVKMKGIDNNFNFLNRHRNEDYWIFSCKNKNTLYQTHHTRKELEEAGFGEVFNSPLFEIEKVEE